MKISETIHSFLNQNANLKPNPVALVLSPGWYADLFVDPTCCDLRNGEPHWHGLKVIVDQAVKTFEILYDDPSTRKGHSLRDFEREYFKDLISGDTDKFKAIFEGVFADEKDSDNRNPPRRFDSR
jgi:hypothetical protein